VNATFTGMHALDDRLPCWSAAERERELAEMRRLRLALNDSANPSVQQLRTIPVQLDAELARANVDVRIAEAESGFFHARNPALWTGEAIFGVVSLLIRDFAPAHERLRAIRLRLAAIPAFLDALPGALNGAAPAHWIARAQRECAAADGLFDLGLRAWLQAHDVPEHAAQPVLDAAATARAAFARTAAWLTTVTHAPDTGYSAGAATFTTLLTRGHFCDEPADSLLTRALRELAAEQSALRDMTAAAGFATWDDAQRAMADDHPTAAAYLDSFQQRWDSCHRVAHEHDAVHWPAWPIRYVPIPEWAAEWAPQLYWLFYRSPAPFDAYSTYEYVVTPVTASMPEAEQERRLRAWNNSTITLNHVVHHGAVGHHVQNWHARHQSASRIGQIAAVDCASRIGMFLGGSMAEGWACYATKLMEELGMLTPLEQLSEQHTRVRMLARAIVDIRLHCGLATFSESVQFYQDVVAMPIETATAEATKNSMFPCTAIMYWLGTSRILTLRDQLRASQGANFSLRRFHDELLSRGAIPVYLAAQLMTETAS
jgi:hypothetical protein